MDDLLAIRRPESSGPMGQMRDVIFAELIKAGEITQAQADAFEDIHGSLVEAGLME